MPKKDKKTREKKKRISTLINALIEQETLEEPYFRTA
jgi:hypothetical protein